MKKRRQLRLQPCLMLNEGEGRSGRRAGGGDGGGDDDGVGDGEGRMGRKWWALVSKQNLPRHFRVPSGLSSFLMISHSCQVGTLNVKCSCVLLLIMFT